MELRFFRDIETGEAHVLRHGLTEGDVSEVFDNEIEDGAGSGDTRVLIGRTDGGRLIRVIYLPDPIPDSVFVITAYPLGPVALRALRRRLRGRS